MTDIFELLYNMLTYLCYMVVVFKFQKVVTSIITFAEQILDSEQKLFNIKIEKIVLITYSICVIIEYINNLAYHTIDIFNPTNITNHFDELSYFIPKPQYPISVALLYVMISLIPLTLSLSGALLIPVIIYSYLVYVIYAVKYSFIGKVFKKETSVNELKLIWLQILKMKRKLEENLNTIPFLAMSIVFMNATTNVVVFGTPTKEDKRDKINSYVQSTSQWMYEIIIAIPIMAIPIFISWTETRLKSRLHSIKLKLMHKSEMTTEIETLISEVEPNLEMNLTGYKMFKLNKEFILGFISSIITFSVLLLQLTQS